MKKLWLVIILILFLNLANCEQQKLEPQPGLKYLVVYGDTRTGHDRHRHLVAAMANFKPDYAFHTGDLVETGSMKEQWTVFNEISRPLVETALFFPSLGNHEQNSFHYFANFDLPNNEQWYFVDIRNLRFIVLDSNWDCSPGSPQLTWLEKTLSAKPDNISFTCTLFHHPIFTCGPHGPDEKNWMPNIVPLLEKYGVDIVFNGHNHSYERFLHNSIIYIITGGGGAPLYEKCRNSPFLQVYKKKHHFCLLSVYPEYVKVEVVDINSDLIDQIVVPFKQEPKK